MRPETEDLLRRQTAADMLFIASDRQSLYAVPVETILALPRCDARTGKEVG